MCTVHAHVKLDVFWDFEACRKLGEVLRKLGVLRLKDLDVGITNCKSGRIFVFLEKFDSVVFRP